MALRFDTVHSGLLGSVLETTETTILNLTSTVWDSCWVWWPKGKVEAILFSPLAVDSIGNWSGVLRTLVPGKMCRYLELYLYKL